MNFQSLFTNFIITFLMLNLYNYAKSNPLRISNAKTDFSALLGPIITFIRVFFILSRATSTPFLDIYSPLRRLSRSILWLNTILFIHQLHTLSLLCAVQYHVCILKSKQVELVVSNDVECLPLLTDTFVYKIMTICIKRPRTMYLLNY